MKKFVVIYHKNCLDGFGAAWAAWRALKDEGDYFGVEPRELPNKIIKNKIIYFLDTTPSLEGIKFLQKRGNHLVVLDHHISNQENIQKTDEYNFSLDHSGAALSWFYFHPKKKIPKLLAYIEDYDLWRFKLPWTKEIITAIQFVDYDFQKWEKLARDLEKKKTFNQYLKKGKLLIEYEKKIVEKILKNSQKVKINGHRGLAINSPILEDSLGDFLRKKIGLGIVWRVEKDKIKVSLRSNSKIDVSKIAKKFGGGGHKKAAGFFWPLDKKLPWKIIP